MKSTRWMFTLLISLLVVLVIPERSYGCSVPPPTPTGTPALITINGNIIKINFGPVFVFPINTTHDCVCGIGVGMTGVEGLASLLLTNATLRDSNGNVIQQFDLMLDPITTVGLASGPVLIPGGNWFGFHGSVNPFAFPADGVASLEFSGTIDPIEFEFLNGMTAQIASGVGNGSNPVFDPNDPHHVRYVATTLQTPEPATILLLGAGLAGVAVKMRKRLKTRKTAQGSQ